MILGDTLCWDQKSFKWAFLDKEFKPKKACFILSKFRTEPAQVWIYSVLASMFQVNLGQGLGVQRAQSWHLKGWKILFSWKRSKIMWAPKQPQVQLCHRNASGSLPPEISVSSSVNESSPSADPPVKQQNTYMSGRWLQPLWQIFVNRDDYSQDMEKNMFQTTNQTIAAKNDRAHF